MHFRILNALYEFIRPILPANWRRDSPLLTEGGASNVIEVDFLKGAKKGQRSTLSIGADETTESLELRLKFPPHVHSRMNMVKRLTGVRSHTETIRRALTNHDTLVLLRDEGKSFYYRDKHGRHVPIDLMFDE